MGSPQGASGDAIQPGEDFADRSADRSAIPAAAEIKPAEQQIRIDNFAFTPATITIPVGTRVTWVNRDDVPHTVTSKTRLFVSPALDTEGKFEYVFDKPGTYVYYCSVHPHMIATVIVK
jgi:plastocyanin